MLQDKVRYNPEYVNVTISVLTLNEIIKFLKE